jgi:uncharacterized membrane protein
VSGNARRPLHRRDGGIEFDRVANFSDAVFAIALTLLVVSIDIPSVKGSELGHALDELRPQIQSFFIGFAVIAFYWFGHHAFFAVLRAVDTGLMVLNAAYLAAIAFVPFPTALVGEYGEQPIAVVILALTLGAASLLDTLMLTWAARRDLLRAPMTPSEYRHGWMASLIPAVVLAISIPIAYVDSGLAMLSWLLIFPAERILDRVVPPDAPPPRTDPRRA